MGSVVTEAEDGKPLNMASMEVDVPSRIPLEEVFMRVTRGETQ